MGKLCIYFKFLLIVQLLATLLGTAGSANINNVTSCGYRMECVPRYLCQDDSTIIKDGRALIDFRTTSFSRAEHPDCKFTNKCCSLTDKKEKLETVEYRPLGCGYSNPKGIRLTLVNTLNGESQFGEFPWMVGVLSVTCVESKCFYSTVGGGSLLAPNVVVTVAHNIQDLATTDLKVRAGEWDSQSEAEVLPFEERNVKTKIVHENFDKISGRNDVALLIMVTPFNLNAHIGTICLPRGNADFTNTRCIVTGWGKRQVEASDYPRIMKKIDLPFVNKVDCQNQLRKTRLGNYFELDNSFVCAGGEKDKDACLGDGGSPLACPLRQNPDRYQLAGIVSWGVECGVENMPGVYANIANLRSWITAKLAQYGISGSHYTI